MTSTDLGYRISQVYSQALFDICLEQGSLEEVKGDLEGLGELMEADELFIGVMVSPYFSGEQKKVLTQKVFAGKLSVLTLNFLAAMISHSRMTFLPQVIGEYVRLYKKHHNYLDIHITVSRTMRLDEVQALEAVLKGVVPCERMTLGVSVDESIIGGIIIRYNDVIIDNSIRRRLNRAVETIIKQGYQRENVYET